jgi:virginiamycin B lyase
MRKLLVVAISLAILGAVTTVVMGAGPSVALSGVVRSQAEGPMEGVIVTAKRAGGTIAVSVVTDKTGTYSFPADRLVSGEYNLSIRAVGYGQPDVRTVTVDPTKKKDQNLTLAKIENVLPQITWGEFLTSVPGTQAQKDELYSCVGCHAPTPIMQSTYDEEGFVTTIVRMHNWAPSSSLSNPQLLPYRTEQGPRDAEFAKFLSTINMGSDRSKLPYSFTTRPRPTGKATRVIYTEYDLPRRGAEPHDAIVDAQGMIWYDDFGQAVLGRLDPKTGETKEWQLPSIKQGVPQGSLCLAVDKAGNIWIAKPFSAGIIKFDPKTEKTESWNEPAPFNNNESRTTFLAISPDGSTWFDDTHNMRLNQVRSGSEKVTGFPVYPGMNLTYTGSGARGPKPRGHSMYGIAVDSKGTPYWADIAGGNLGELDPETGKTTLYPPPTVNSGIRRMHIDWEDKVWFGESYGDKIGMFDTKTKQFKEWDDPAPWDAPYDAVRDKSDHVWTGSWSTDLASRLDPKTGELVQYLLPTFDTNIRRVEVINTTNPPSFLIGENHQAKIAIVQPLE